MYSMSTQEVVKIFITKNLTNLYLPAVELNDQISQLE